MYDRLTLIDLNPFEFKHYPFMINLDEFSGSCNVLSPKICVPMKIKDINLKAFNMIKNEIGAKAMSKHISCDCECKFNSTCNSNQKWNNETCQCECKNYRTSKKDYSWNSSTCIYENSKYLKSMADISVIEYNETISFLNIVSTKMKNNIATNVRNDCPSTKVWDCYILHTFLLFIKLLLMITIICYYYSKHR